MRLNSWSRTRAQRMHWRRGGLVVPHLSHKREFAGSIPAGCTKNFSCPLLLSPHPLHDVRLRLAPSILWNLQENLNPPNPDKTAQPLQSTGEEQTRGDQVLSMYHAFRKNCQSIPVTCPEAQRMKNCPSNKDGVMFKKKPRVQWNWHFDFGRNRDWDLVKTSGSGSGLIKRT
jgi:hypothetical protein